MTSPFISPNLADAFKDVPTIDLSTSMGPGPKADQAGFFESMFSAGTKEQIGMNPSPGVERYRIENPGKGFVSMVLPELALWSIPSTKLGAIAVKSLRPAAALLKYGEAIEKTRPFLGGATKFTGQMLPLFGARQVASAFAPEEGSFQRTLERNITDVVFGGALAGSAEYLSKWRGAQRPELAPGRNEPFKSYATVFKHFGREYGVDLNNPAQDKLASFLRILEDPKNAGNPVLPDVIRAANFARAEARVEAPGKYRSFVTPTSMGNRKDASILNKLFRRGKPMTEVDPAFGIESLLPKDWETHTKYLRGFEVQGQADKSKVWGDLMDNMERVDENTFLTQQVSDGLFIVAKKANSQEAGMNNLFVGRPDIPDRYLIMKTSRPWEVIENGKSRRWLKDVFVDDTHYKAVSEHAFLDSPIKVRGSKVISLNKEGVEASVLPGNTPTDDATAKMIDLAEVWKKGLIGVAESTDQLETPHFVRRVLDTVSKTLPVNLPFSELTPTFVKTLTRETGFLIRDHVRAARKFLAPAQYQFALNPRAQVLNQITTQSFHDLLGRVRTDLWGVLDDEAIKTGLGTDTFRSRKLWKNLFMRLHDVRTGGILGRVASTLTDDAKLADFSKAWRMGWGPEDAAKNGLGSEVVDLLWDIKKFDEKMWTEMKATRAKLNVEDDFNPMENHYALSRMWEGDFRVELFDDVTGEVVGIAGGRSPDAALKRADQIVELVNKEQGKNALRTPTREHLSTTEHLRASREMATDASRLSKEVDAYQRGSKLSADNFLVRKVIDAAQKLQVSDPARFLQRTGQRGFTGEFESLTVDDILKTLTGNAIETQRIITRESLMARLGPEMAKLKEEFPDMYRQYVIRFNSHLGFQGPVAKSIDNIFNKALAPVLGPNAAMRISRKMNRGMMNLTLSAGDMGFLAVNNLTGIQTLMPEAALLLNTPPARLAHRYGLGFLQTEQGPRVFHFLDPAKQVIAGFKDLKNLTFEKDPALFEDVIWAKEKGIIGKPIIAEMHEFGQQAESTMKAGNPIEAIMDFNERLIGRSEEFSRAWAFVTGRRIGLELGQTAEQARETARKFVSYTMYEYTAGDRARVMTGAVGQAWGLFKNWTAHYMSNLAGYANEGVYRGNWAPFVWGMLGTGAVGGVVAMPMYGAMDTMSKLLSDKSILDWIYDTGNFGGKAGNIVADSFAYGVFSNLGFSLQGRASAPTSSAIRDTTMYANMAVLDRAKGLYNFFSPVVQQIAAGNANVLSDKRVQRGFMQAFAPRTLQRAYTYWGQEGLHSLKTGNKLVDKVNKTDAFLHTIGLTPMDVERAFDTSAELYEDMNKVRGRIQFWGESYAQAMQASDYPEMSRIHRQVWNEQLPLDSVVRSATSRVQKDNDDLLERQFDELKVSSLKRRRGW